LIDGQPAAALVRWMARRRSIASRLRGLPVVVGNSGSSGAPVDLTRFGGHVGAGLRSLLLDHL
jgi:hypothetical protein